MKNYIRIILLTFFPIIVFSQYADGGEIYFKGTIGIGVATEKVYSGIRIREDGDITKNIYIYPGGGLNFEWGMGVHITPALKTEFEVAYQSSGDRFNNGTVIFRRFPVGISIVNEFQKHDKYLLYGKLGLLGIATPKYYDELNGSKFEIKYKYSYGGQIGIGLMRRVESEKVYFFVEGRYLFGKNINWHSAQLDEVDQNPSEDFKSLTSNGFFINIGIGYYY